jgi:hypothetical protein
VKTLVAFGHSRVKYPKKDNTLSPQDQVMLNTEA